MCLLTLILLRYHYFYILLASQSHEPKSDVLLIFFTFPGDKRNLHREGMDSLLELDEDQPRGTIAKVPWGEACLPEVYKLGSVPV